MIDLRKVAVPQDRAVRRNRVLAWHDERLVSIVGRKGLECADAGWMIERVELTADGQYVAAWGDTGTRMKVWRADGYVDIVTRATEQIERRAAIALDPYRMDIALEDDGRIVIETLPAG